MSYCQLWKTQFTRLEVVSIEDIRQTKTLYYFIFNILGMSFNMNNLFCLCLVWETQCLIMNTSLLPWGFSEMMDDWTSVGSLHCHNTDTANVNVTLFWLQSIILLYQSPF